MDRIEPTRRVFRSSTTLILVPGLFFGVALILRNSVSTILTWVLLMVGAVTAIAVISSFTTISLNNEVIGIKNLRKSWEVSKDEMVAYSRRVSTAKGIETITWKLFLKKGEPVTISSDLIKEKEGLKEAIDQFLKGIPKK